MKALSYLKLATLCCTMSLTIFSCKKDPMADEMPLSEDQMAAQALARVSSNVSTFYALTTSNELVKYVSENQIKEAGAMPIMGLMSAEKILAVDFRPATGQLYGVSNQNRIYIINTNTAMATAVGSAPFSTDNLGEALGFDFNPTVDRIRLVSSKGNNLRLHPETGAIVATDGAISMPMASLVGAAYTNSMAGASSTTLYDIDAATDKLYKQDPPNAGTLVEVGMLGVQVVGEGGFDIAAGSNIAIAALFGRGYEAGQMEQSNGNKYRFYTIDLNNGMATNIGKTDREIIGLAIPTMMVSYAVDASNNLWIMHPEGGSMVSKAITGLDAMASIVGIDMRPATGQLYALASNSRIYTINTASGAATAIGAAFMPALEGTSFGFDFNPTVDRIRVVSNTGQNLRLHPTTGMVAATDGTIKPAGSMVDAVAYTNNFPGATSTTLFDVDAATDMLYMQTPPNNGDLTNGMPLGIDLSNEGGFDIGGSSNMAWGIFKVGMNTSLYSVNLSTGMATSLMPISANIKGFAVGLGF